MKEGDTMNITKEYVLVAPCGLSCGHCPAYQSKDNPAIMEYLVTMGANRDDLPSLGCRPLEGKPAWCRNVNRLTWLKIQGKYPMTSSLKAAHAQPILARLNMAWISAMSVRNL